MTKNKTKSVDELQLTDKQVTMLKQAFLEYSKNLNNEDLKKYNLTKNEFYMMFGQIIDIIVQDTQENIITYNTFKKIREE